MSKHHNPCESMNKITITVRFYEELNDHLPEKYRKKDLSVEMNDAGSVEDLVKKFKIPLSEVHLVLVNGENSNLGRNLKNGDRISVYPIFESLDISPIKKIVP